MGTTPRNRVRQAESQVADVTQPGDATHDELAERYLSADPDEQISLWLQSPEKRDDLDRLDATPEASSTRTKGWVSRLLGLRE